MYLHFGEALQIRFITNWDIHEPGRNGLRAVSLDEWQHLGASFKVPQKGKQFIVKGV